MKLRAYQEKAISDLYNFLETKEGNPCIVLPTGSGKTPVIAQICKDALGWGERVIVLAHVKELLEQNVDKLGIIAPELSVGVYSAGLNSRDTDEPVLVAGIQSIWDKADQIGPRGLIIVDEAHLISPNEASRYACFIELMKTLNEGVRVIGLTATPYRLDSGALCGPDSTLNEICHETFIGDLIEQGFLSKLSLKAVAPEAVADLSEVGKRGGEFIESELAFAVNQPNVVRAACSEIIVKAKGRKSILVFATGIAHAEHIVEVLNSYEEAGVVAILTGNTPSPERALMLQQFKDGGIRFMVNVMVLTTGFDAPNVDCVCILRPTLSPGLYYQMIGRGFRIDDKKEDCLVLDFGSNIYRHGPIDCIEAPYKRGQGGDAAPAKGNESTIRAKECPDCHELVDVGAKGCSCGFVFPEKLDTHSRKNDEDSVLLGRGPGGAFFEERSKVEDTYYSVHTKKDSPEGHPKTMRVEYYTSMTFSISEWVCFEHSGFAFSKAQAWWAARSKFPCPRSSAEAVRLANSGALAESLAIITKKKAGVRWPDLISVDLGPIPVAAFVEEEDEFGTISSSLLSQDSFGLPF